MPLITNQVAERVIVPRPFYPETVLGLRSSICLTQWKLNNQWRQSRDDVVLSHRRRPSLPPREASSRNPSRSIFRAKLSAGKRFNLSCRLRSRNNYKTSIEAVLNH